MIKEKISIIIDAVLTLLVVTFFAFTAFTYFLHDLRVVIPAAVAAGICVTAVISIRRAAKRKKNGSGKNEKILREFIFKGEAFSSDFVCEALKNKFGSIEVNDGFFTAKGTAIFMRFNFPPPDVFTLGGFYAKAKASSAEKIIVLTSRGADAKTLAFISGLKPEINVFDLDKSISFLSYCGRVLEPEITPKKTKIPVLTLLKGALRPENARRYLMASFMLAFPSLFVRGAIYWLVMAAVTLTLAVASLSGIKRF